MIESETESSNEYSCRLENEFSKSENARSTAAEDG